MSEFFKPGDFKARQLPDMLCVFDEEDAARQANAKVAALVTENEKLKARCRAIGYACEVHDLIHAMTCAYCRELVENERDTLKAENERLKAGLNEIRGPIESIASTLCDDKDNHVRKEFWEIRIRCDAKEVAATCALDTQLARDALARIDQLLAGGEGE